MTTDIRNSLAPLIRSAQAAVRACEQDPRAGTLRTVIEHLEPFLVDDLDPEVYELVDRAAALAAAAITCPETSGTVEVNYELGVMLNEGPEEKTEDDPTVAAVIALTGQCFARFKEAARTDVDKAAWGRAYKAGVKALGILMKLLPDYQEWSGSESFRVSSAVDRFLAAVHRAIAYEALYGVRAALVEVAESVLLFPIGGRQPVQGMEGRGWSRRIGGALYRFEVIEARPLENARAGLIVATRVDLETGEHEERHALPRRWDNGPHGGYGPHRVAEDAELARI